MENCIFCKIVRGEAPSAKVMENEFCLAFLDINPASRYHTLVIPKQHYVNIFDVPEEALREVISMVRDVSLLYNEKLGIKNIQIENNNGRAAQQDVFHIHYHVVPRSFGDGQNLKWRVHEELREEFDKMLEKLK